MLDARSRGICAWYFEGSIMCSRCAVQHAPPLALARIEVGLEVSDPDGSLPRPMIRYELDEIQGERQYEEAEQARAEGDEERAKELEESMESYRCDECGEECDAIPTGVG